MIRVPTAAVGVISAATPGIVGAALLLPGLILGPSQDAAIFASASVRLRTGATLYAGIWDHKPPGVYLIDATAQAALPWLGPWVPIWLLSVLAIAASALITTAVLGRAGQGLLARLGGGLFVAVALAIPPVAQGGGHTEHLAIVPGAAAFALAAFGSRSRALFGAGALLGIALLISVQVAPALVAVVAVGAGRGTRARGIASLAGGLITPLLLAVGLLAWAGLYREAWDSVVRYGAAYRLMNLEFQGPIIASRLGAGILASAVALIPIGVGVIRSIRREGDAWSLGRVCVGWLAVGAAWIAFQGRLDGHYVVPLAVPAAILFGIGLPHVVDPSISRGRAVVMYGVPVVILAAISTVVVIGGSETIVQELEAENRSAAAVAATIRAQGVAGDTVFVWGNRAQVYYLADRAPATRYLYLAPLTTPGYSSAGQVDEVLGSWGLAPPAFVVDAGSAEPGAPGLPPLLIARPLSANGRDYDALDPLREFVRARYELVGVIEGWPVYRLMTP